MKHRFRVIYTVACILYTLFVTGCQKSPPVGGVQELNVSSYQTSAPATKASTTKGSEVSHTLGGPLPVKTPEKVQKLRLLIACLGAKDPVDVDCVYDGVVGFVSDSIWDMGTVPGPAEKREGCNIYYSLDALDRAKEAIVIRTQYGGKGVEPSDHTTLYIWDKGEWVIAENFMKRHEDEFKNGAMRQEDY